MHVFLKVCITAVKTPLTKNNLVRKHPWSVSFFNSYNLLMITAKIVILLHFCNFIGQLKINVSTREKLPESDNYIIIICHYWGITCLLVSNLKLLDLRPLSKISQSTRSTDLCFLRQTWNLWQMKQTTLYFSNYLRTQLRRVAKMHQSKILHAWERTGSSQFLFLFFSASRRWHNIL